MDVKRVGSLKIPAETEDVLGYNSPCLRLIPVMTFVLKGEVCKSGPGILDFGLWQMRVYLSGACGAGGQDYFNCLPGFGSG